MSIIERLPEIKKQIAKERRRQRRQSQTLSRKHQEYLGQIRNETHRLADEVSQRVGLDEVFQELKEHLNQQGHDVLISKRFNFTTEQDGSGIKGGRLTWSFCWFDEKQQKDFEITLQNEPSFPSLTIQGGGQFSLFEGAEGVNVEQFKDAVAKAFLNQLQKSA